MRGDEPRAFLESRMNLVPSTLEAYPVQHLPLVKAYADKMSLVEPEFAVARYTDQ
jgi:hypothetical protein